LPEPVLLELAEKSGIVRAHAGDVLFQKDQPGRSLYLLLTGEAMVHDGDYVATRLKSGICFGELALLDAGPRSMSVTATEPSLFARIHREVFFEVIGDHPDLMQKIMGILAQRLRSQTDQTLDQLRRKELELTRLVEERTSELTRQKEEAEFQRQRAEQSERSEQRFLANMSHEIRTPMNAVMGMTRLLLQKNPREDQLRYLHSIRQSSEALLVILNDILDISKIQAGRMELEWTDLRVTEILDNVYSTLRFRAEEKGLAMRLTCDPDIPAVLTGDPVRLQQILLNLAGNSVKFTEKGQIDLIARCLEKTDTRCRLLFEVRDTGIGMTPEQVDRAFESFRQASGDTTRKYGGTGLGLSICRQLTDLFQGKIEVESTLGKGSSFQVFIDLDIATDAAPKKDVLVPGAIEMLRGKRILIAEDNAFNRIVAVETLELLIPDVKVSAVENGREALMAVQSATYDVVLMDISMPVMDGLEASRAIRALPPPLNSIPIIAFTASVTNKEVKKCMEAGMNGCVPKPFKDSELIGALSAVLTGQTAIPASPASPASGFDALQAIAGGNPARVRKYLNLYLESAQTALPRIESALAENDRDALRRAVHTIKPQFKLIGKEDTAALAQIIETQAVEGTGPEVLPVHVAQLLTAIRQSVTEVEAYLASDH
jgi:signal transduction histidine kinase/DNA-binding NarL/FixJ family response regulator